MTHIAGAKARQLLAIWGEDEDGLIAARRGVYDNYGDLFESAPDLAETVAWLYSGEMSPDVEVDGNGVRVFVADMHGDESEYLTPDEAVDLARALLTAAEEARR